MIKFIKGIFKRHQDWMNDALATACSHGDMEAARMLVKWGADVHAFSGIPLYEAARFGHLDMVRFLIERGVDVHIMDDAALREACQWGKADVVRFLIDSGANVHADKGAALKEAAQKGHLEIVCLLLNHGGDCEVAKEYGTDGIKAYVQMLEFKEALEAALPVSPINQVRRKI